MYFDALWSFESCFTDVLKQTTALRVTRTKKSSKKTTSFSLFTCYAWLRKVPIVWISTSLKLFDSRKATPLFTCIQRLFLNKTKIRRKLAACLKTKSKKQGCVRNSVDKPSFPTSDSKREQLYHNEQWMKKTHLRIGM